MDFLLFKQLWTSKITESYIDEQEFYFVDEGTELPFFLKKWRHKHRIIKLANKSEIRDEVEFSAAFGWASLLLYPAIYLQFLYRRPIYRRVFS